MTGSAGTVHAGAVRVGRHGVLVLGAPGSGKSSLILALIEDPRQDAVLVADDRVVLAAGTGLLARAPETIAGLIEVRGVGVVRRPYLAEARIDLAVELRPIGDCPRLPAAADLEVVLAGVTLPRLILPSGCHDASLRVRVALGEWLPSAAAPA
ncbi:MAG: HPr kinase/phosphatase C-terminal domain-containing protein [Bauldia sp.]|nr:HPr kinase/phosphatase C-terminal domain-containing protein [Bauldia sp.]MCW5716825.1 HPr kinase/phosphatase C-terminal domain-containing protein [Bauldia sp.]